MISALGVATCDSVACIQSPRGKGGKIAKSEGIASLDSHRAPTRRISDVECRMSDVDRNILLAILKPFNETLILAILQDAALCLFVLRRGGAGQRSLPAAAGGSRACWLWRCKAGGGQGAETGEDRPFEAVARPCCDIFWVERGCDDRVGQCDVNTMVTSM